MKKSYSNASSVYVNGVQLVTVGCVTGVFSGIAVSVYNVCASFTEKTAKQIYEIIRANPIYIPLFLIALLMSAFIFSVAIKIIPMVKGSGIPQTEGATRGMVRFKWYRDAVAMFAISLLSIFMGLSAGAEGPSVHIGAAMGDGVASVSKRNEMVRRYQITGGACAGLAIAVGAPMSGMAFAFEEAHKRFTSEVFICAFSSVIAGMLTKSAVYNVLGLEIHAGFHSFVLSEIPFKDYGFVALSSIICGILGVILYKSIFCLKTLFSKFKIKSKVTSDWLKMAIAVVLGGIFSLITVNVMGGGHALIDSLGSKAESSVPLVFGIPVIGSLLIVLILKTVTTIFNMSVGVPCGTFIPMLAIGACIGALTSEIWMYYGMETTTQDTLIMICMAAFFAAVVKAPITAVVMVVEMTFSFTPLLPVIIGVSIGYFISDLARTDSIYETILELFVKDNESKVPKEKHTFKFTVSSESTVVGRTIRQILWPNDTRVAMVIRDGERIIPDGGTEILAGDEIGFACITNEPERIKKDLMNILGVE